MKTCLIIFMLLFCILVSPGFVQGAENTGTPNNMIELGKILGIFLILSVIFEIALEPIFNWTVFLLYCEGRGCKTPIKVALALFVTLFYELNILTRVLEVLIGGNIENYRVGQVLTALLIAGGSDGIYRIFTRLGLRNPLARKEKAEQLRQEHNKETIEGEAAEQTQESNTQSDDKGETS